MHRFDHRLLHSSVALSAFTLLCSSHHRASPGFFTFLTDTLSPLHNNPPFSFPILPRLPPLCALLLSHVWLFATPRTIACQISSVHGIPQARILQWVAISFSRGSSQPRDRTHEHVSLASPALAGRFFTTEPPGSPPVHGIYQCTSDSLNLTILGTS